MAEVHQFVNVSFRHFKAFDTFRLNLRHFNILVGPNNAGKSTIIAAFRILAAAMRKASARSSEVITGPQGHTFGYVVDLRAISIAEENLFYNYDDSELATVIQYRSSRMDAFYASVELLRYQLFAANRLWQALPQAATT